MMLLDALTRSGGVAHVETLRELGVPPWVAGAAVRSGRGWPCGLCDGRAPARALGPRRSGAAPLTTATLRPHAAPLGRDSALARRRVASRSPAVRPARDVSPGPRRLSLR